MNDINLLYVGIDGAAVTVMLLVAIQLARQAPDRWVAFLVAFIMAGSISYVISARDDYGMLIDAPFRLDLGSLHPLFNLLRNAISGAFMLLCHAIFRDGHKPPRVLIGLWLFQLLAEEPLDWLIGDWGSGTVTRTLLLEALPSVLQITFGVFALYWMLADRDADLVGSRRRARILIVTIVAVQSVLSLMLERVAFQLGWVPLDWQYPIHVMLVALGLPFLGLLLFASMSPDTSLVLGARRRPASVPADRSLPPREATDTARVRSAFEEEQIYRQAGLTVRELAQHLALPEYRLRNLIHEHMGFRNFNALLHHYRVGEVSTALEDPAQNTTPVLTLALCAGYQSINPFNRAFRELKGMTPTEYRRRSQLEVDSSNSTPDTESGALT